MAFWYCILVILDIVQDFIIVKDIIGVKWVHYKSYKSIRISVWFFKFAESLYHNVISDGMAYRFCWLKSRRSLRTWFVPCEVVIVISQLQFAPSNLQDSFNLVLFCVIHDKYTMWKFTVKVVPDFGSSLRPDVDHEAMVSTRERNVDTH